jgi:hypothetical protein
MAKKRGGGGGGSNLPLIMTLVFFILSTVILGVTTYMGYNEIDKERSEAKKAKQEASEREREKDWYRFQARVLREYIGRPMVKDDEREVLAKERENYDKGGLTFAPKDAAGEDFKNFLGAVKPAMPWNAPGEKSPSATYESRLLEKDKQYANMSKLADQLARDKSDAEKRVKSLEDDLKKAKETFDAEIVKLNKDADAQRKKNEEDLQKLRDDLARENKLKGQALVKQAETEKTNATLGSKLKGETTKLKTALGDKRKLLDENSRLEDEKRILAEKASSGDLQALESERLDARALDVLKNWTKRWRIDSIDPRGVAPYINLGTADGLKPQLTFSVHSVGSNDKLSLTPKAKVEVVRVLGPHLAKTRVTWVKDPKADPIVKGDRLFNPTWDPNRRKRVAIAGLVDLGGEGLDSSEDFRRLLARQSVDVDAYINTSGKLPKTVGNVSSRTDYLILADKLEDIRDDLKPGRYREKDFIRDFDLQMRKLREEAQNNGVTIIPLRRYLEMIGYQPRGGGHTR